jgi:nucleotide-binding universal stress UspA family protein
MALKLLVTLDGSPFSEKVLDVAVPLATKVGAAVYLLRVNPPAHDVAQIDPNLDPRAEAEEAALMGHVPPGPRVRELETVTQAAERMAAEALDYLYPLAARFHGVRAECLVREGADPAATIVQCAEELGVDLVAMATHGRSGLLHLLLGSVAEAVVRAGKTPVLLVRPAV